jgi:hypothetical protein
MADTLETRDLVKTLLDRAEKFHLVRAGYNDRTQEYVYFSAFCPKEQIPIGATLEPVVPAPEWNLDDNAKLTVNRNNALVLNTRNLLVIDVDFDDPHYNKWAVANVHQLVEHLQDLAALDAVRHAPWEMGDELAPILAPPPAFRWSDQTWILNTTQNGARLICRDQCVLTSQPYGSIVSRILISKHSSIFTTN